MKIELLPQILGLIPSNQSMLLIRRYGVPVLQTLKAYLKNVIVFNLKKPLEIEEITEELEKHKYEQINLVIDNFNADGKRSNVEELRYFTFHKIHGDREQFLHKNSRVIFIVNKSNSDKNYDNNDFDKAYFDRLWVCNITK